MRRQGMTPSPVAMRLALLVLLALSVGARAFGAERETGPDAAAAAAAPAAPVPAPTVALDASAGRLLPADAVLLATLAPPPAPAMGTGGAALLQGGGPPPPQLRYYALDALGSVRVTFDAAGNVIGRADYEPFGAAVPASTTGTQPRQQFTGQERDGEVGVDYFGARLYLPAHGRMPSVDPLYTGAVEEPQRWNRYAYALNNPLRYVDPDGRLAHECATTEVWGTITVDGVEVTGYHTTAVCKGGSASGGDWSWESVTQWFQDRLQAPVGGNEADTWTREPIWYAPPKVKDPDGVNGPESDGNVTVEDAVSDAINGGANIASLEKAAVKQTVSVVKRSSTAKRTFLKGLAQSDKVAAWMKPWLEEGRNPPGYDVDHIKPISVGGADDPSNMRLQGRALHRLWHHFYTPWKRR